MSRTIPSPQPTSPVGALGRVGSFLGRCLDLLLPRWMDVGPAVLTATLGFVPLAIARTWISLSVAPTATAKDLWRVQFGDIECWCLVALVGALLLRRVEGRLRTLVRFGFHAFGTTLLLLSIVELVYFAVTGGRADIDLLAFSWDNLGEVAPVFLSEVKAWHLVLLSASVLAGLSPMLVRFRPQASPAFGRLALLLLLPPTVMEYDGHRPRPQKALKILQPSLIESLWWDEMDRVGDTTIAPTPDELAPITLTRTAEKKPFNIVLVLLESTSAQSTSVYRSDLDTTPNLARLAHAGWWVRSATAVMPHTSKAIVSTLCGTWPDLVMAIRESQPGGLPQRCLPNMLKELGYRTAFFQTAQEGFENRGSLVHQLGFDLFRSRDTLRGPEFETVNYFGIEDRAMLAPGLDWSKTGGDQPFFATYLTLTTHHDYGVPTHFQKEEYPKVKARQAQYFNCVRYVDDFVGRLVKEYEDAGLADNTLFIFQGDHGEAFNEHGRSMHDLVIYEEGLRIPMVLYGPGVLEGTGTIEGPRQQVDIVPTLLDMLGVKATGGLLPGQSLWSPVDAARSLFHSCWRAHRCLAERKGDAKFIDNYRDAAMQFFDVAADPKEHTDLVGKQPAGEVNAARTAMRNWRSRVNGRYEAVNAAAMLAAQHPEDTRPAVATWGGKMELVGCETENPAVLPAEAVWLRCRWRTKEELSQAWRVDARIEGAFAPVSSDWSPFQGVFPTFKWPAGVVVEDEIPVFVPPDAPPGVAHIALGWERYGNGTISRDDGGDRLPVADVTVLPPLHPYVKGASEGGVPEPPSEDPGEGGEEE